MAAAKRAAMRGARAAMAALTQDELLRLLAAAKEYRTWDWLFLLVTYTHGLRVSETIELAKGDFTDGHITVQRLKGSLKTTQPLVSSDNPLLNERDAVLAYLATLGPRQRLFDITRQGAHVLIRRHCATAGISEHKAHVHTLKHTRAMLAIHHAGIENVRQYLGHRSIASTGAYLKVSDEAASRAMDAATQF